ncbi:unnamed protein product [Notodromas monacha]|uniref:3-beta hydroxysteroid dehydrogenase/isomerase domain-containing protein n=1 Tax=Notodromas monacha TaxID=399045 RepID=A0A7R9BER6_9CRUS|nr:unnamed protein product [Notodromas monacha]CAG0914005.1 unnamed protein product [Notodromas monacha]
MKVIVTGASGCLGQYLVKLLIENADEVKEIVAVDARKFCPTIQMNLDLKKFLFVECDIREVSKMEPLFKGVDCVFHTAALVSIGHFPDRAGMKDINENGTRIVVELSRRFNVPYLVYTSTADVMMGRKGNLVNATEALVLPPPDLKFMIHPYALTKFMAENIALSADGLTLNDGKRVLRTLSLRPATLYGEGDRHFVVNTMLQAKASGGVLNRMGPSSAKFAAVYVGNAAWAHIVAMRALMQRPGEVAGEAYVITDDTKPQNIFDFLTPFYTARGFTVSDRSVPYCIVILFAFVFQCFVWLLSWVWKWKSAPIPPVNELRYCGHTYTFNISKARERLGYAPLFSFDDGLRNSIQFYSDVKI